MTVSPTMAIIDIARHLPSRILTNEDLASEHPDWDMERVAARAGVVNRHIAAAGETALDLARAACELLLARHPGLRTRVDGIIFCTQTPDYVMPPNACLLHRDLDLPDEVFAMDTSLACSGYVYGLAVAQGLIAAGTCTNILLVTADTYSSIIHRGDRSARTLFGDGAAVTWLAAADGDAGLVDVLCATRGRGSEAFYVPAGGHRTPSSPSTRQEIRDDNGNVRTQEHVHMDGMSVLTFVRSKVPGQVRSLLERNDLTVADLDLVIFHQASKLALDSLERALRLPTAVVFRNLADVGNTVSASIPISLEQARREGLVPAGSTVLLCGFGVGLSWASALVRF